MEECLVNIQNLSKIYDGTSYPAVNNLSLMLPRGKMIGLLGPNGSGKTTLIKMMNGILKPSMGTIFIGGFPVGVETKKHVSYLPDRPYLNNSQTIVECVEMFADMYADFDREFAYRLLNDLQVDPMARMQTLSKGTKEKVQLILVMSRAADLYVLDEPIAGVDPAARDYILNTILSAHAPGSTVLLSTHLIGDIENVLDEVIFIRNGNLLLYNSADYIRTTYGKSVDAYFREVFAC